MLEIKIDKKTRATTLRYYLRNERSIAALQMILRYARLEEREIAAKNGHLCAINRAIDPFYHRIDAQRGVRVKTTGDIHRNYR